MPDPLDELDNLLLDMPWDDDGMLLSEVDGLIAGILVLPQAAANDDWLPLIWGGEPQAFPDDPARSARLVELVIARKTEVVGELLRGDFGYRPLYDVDERHDEILWETWIDGFGRAVAMREAGWRELLTHEDEALSNAALDLARLIAVAGGRKIPKRERDALTEEAPDIIPLLVEMLYRGVRGLARAGIGSRQY